MTHEGGEALQMEQQVVIRGQTLDQTMTGTVEEIICLNDAINKHITFIPRAEWDRNETLRTAVGLRGDQIRMQEMGEGGEGGAQVALFDEKGAGMAIARSVLESVLGSGAGASAGPLEGLAPAAAPVTAPVAPTAPASRGTEFDPEAMGIPLEDFPDGRDIRMFNSHVRTLVPERFLVSLLLKWREVLERYQTPDHVYCVSVSDFIARLAALKESLLEIYRASARKITIFEGREKVENKTLNVLLSELERACLMFIEDSLRDWTVKAANSYFIDKYLEPLKGFGEGLMANVNMIHLYRWSEKLSEEFSLPLKQGTILGRDLFMPITSLMGKLFDLTPAPKHIIELLVILDARRLCLEKEAGVGPNVPKVPTTKGKKGVKKGVNKVSNVESTKGSANNWWNRSETDRDNTTEVLQNLFILSSIYYRDLADKNVDLRSIRPRVQHGAECKQWLYLLRRFAEKDRVMWANQTGFEFPIFIFHQMSFTLGRMTAAHQWFTESVGKNKEIRY